MRDLDAARQAESDLIDRLFRNDSLVLDSQHNALEDAVCGLAPRIFKVPFPNRQQILLHSFLAQENRWS